MLNNSPIPDPTKPFEQQEVTVLVTQCLLGEAANQTEGARAGVGNAGRNRLIHWRPEYGIRTWPGVLLHPGAFDCFRALAPKLMNPLNPPPPFHPETQELWDELFGLASGLLCGAVKDNIERCTFYHSIDLELTALLPYWAKPPVMGKVVEHVIDLGSFHFYRYK